RHLRKFAYDQRLYVRFFGFLIIQVGANIPNVRIREADNLSRVAWVRENFLISREAGIENDFAAPARDRAGSAAAKAAPVFQRENRGSVLNFGQCVLPCLSSKSGHSFSFGFRSRERTKMVHRPVREDRPPIDEPAGHRSKYA